MNFRWVLTGSILAVVVALSALTACQSAPTKIYETPQAPTDELVRAILVDSRTAFEYQVSHPPRSIHIDWNDFTSNQSQFAGILKADLFADMRRLSRLGISPDSQVVLMGILPRDLANMGRTAWTFSLLGIKNVRLMNIDKVPTGKDYFPAEPYPSVNPWKLEPNLKLKISAKEFVSKLKVSDLSQSPWYIDVRTEREYLKEVRVGQNQILTSRLINIPLEQFYTKEGGVQAGLRPILESLGVGPSAKVILLSNRGVRASAAAFSLSKMGYSNPQILEGGYLALASEFGAPSKATK